MASLLKIPGTCKVCGALFPSKKELRVHGKTCKVACGQCAEIFANKTALAEHMKTHRVRFVCTRECGATPFLSQRALDDHMSLGHGVAVASPEPGCREEFALTHTRDRHVKTVHGDTTCKCPCGKVYTRADNMVRHMKECTKVGPSLKCECGLVVPRMDAFKTHQAGCILSEPGAAKAVKHRFEEIKCDNRAEAAMRALEDVAAWANTKMATTCLGCGGGFATVRSMGRHKRKYGH